MVALIAFACKASRFAIALLFVLFSLVEIFPEYRGIRSIKYFTDHRTGNTIQFFYSVLFLSKSQQMGILAKG